MSFLIDVKNLLFKYKTYTEEREKPTEHVALDDISLSIKEGDFVGILGHNGSGKSTLAKQLAALLKPTGGVVYVGGMDTSRDENLFFVRRTAGMVFQNPDNQLIGNVVEEDVAFGPENLGIPPAEIENRIGRALEATGMTAYREAAPGALSGGQKQKIAISGILAMEPKCIVFDEPTAMLDPKGREEVLRAIYALNREKNITMIYITHFMEEVSEADYLFVMNHGKLTLQGTPAELFKQSELLLENNLEPPFSVRLRMQLGERGMDIPKDIGTKEALINFLVEGQKRMRKQTGKPKSIEEISEVAVFDEKPSGGIVLEHVSYQYKKRGEGVDKYALQDVSLTICPGEFVAVVGKTGSGKSTLIQHFNGLLQPKSGKYYFDGEDVWEKGYAKKSLRQKVALCFQYPEYQLFEETVLKDIAFGPKNMGYDEKSSEERARKAMELMGLSPELESKSPFSLSGGQKRRVALAGILAMEPKYLVLDEPAAGMDAPGKRHLFSLLHTLNREKGITVILVSHSMDDVARHVDRVLVMEEGRLKMDGSRREIFSRASELRAMGLGLPQAAEFYLEYLNFYENPERTEAEKLPLTEEELADALWAEQKGGAR